jgi:8-oxo-dGTP diphosphatase
MEKKHLNVVAAVVMKDGKYLCMQRCRSHYPYTSEHWEFPGGITEEGECEHEALMREIREEMDWDIYVGRKIGTVDYEYPDFAITLTAYLCLAADEDFKLLEHLDYRWLERKDLLSLRWTAADEKLIRELIIQ